MCLHSLIGECVCMCMCSCMSVWPLTLKECIRVLSFRLLYAQNVSWLCVSQVSYISMCTSTSCVWDHLPHICRPFDTLRLFLHLASHDQGSKRGQVCSLLALMTWKHGSFIACLPQVLLGAGGGSWLLTSIFFLPLPELWWGKAQMKSMSP